MLACRADGSDGPALEGDLHGTSLPHCCPWWGGQVRGCTGGGKVSAPRQSSQTHEPLAAALVVPMQTEWESLPQHGLLSKILFNYFLVKPRVVWLALMKFGAVPVC